MVPAITPAEAAWENYEISQVIRQLEERKQYNQTIIDNAIELGDIDDRLMEDKKGYNLGGIRVTRICSKRTSYTDKVKAKIKELQEQARVLGETVETVSVSYRYTPISDE